MLFDRFWVFASALFLAHTAVAGNSSSGGGFLYEDGLNPWFLENTTSVDYCLEIDEQHFSLPVDRIETITAEAIALWKAAFKKTPDTFYGSEKLQPFGTIRIATQDFVKVECNESTTLRFQFGTLSKEQKEDYVTDPNRLVAEAVRTAYDHKSLRAKGFIYISPDSGPLRPTDVEMAEQPWSFADGIVLKRVLLHELGHVFGLSHSGTAYELMGAAHPEFMVLKSTITRLKKQNLREVQSYLSRVAVLGFEFPFEREICDPPNTIDIGIENVFDLFFGIPKGSKCRKVVFKPEVIEVYASPHDDGEYNLVGKTEAVQPIRSTKVVSRIKLPKEQEVFQELPQPVRSLGYLDGPSAVSRNVFNVIYESIDGERQGSLKATLLPNQMIELEVVWKNRIVQLMDHGS